MVPINQHSWWSGSDERAIIHFRNGNVYEGGISMKCMHGEGRFRWADGTVYLGQFKDNQIHGKGIIQWKDDTWYEGYFVGSLRHGRGLYVDSRKQRSYTGEWLCGTKHGQGAIYYSGTFKNSYDGDWVNNVRHGFGSREYCAVSGYKGEWEYYTREGKGLMIWPNHDFYRGGWKNDVMSGFGIYIWEACYNNSMSVPSLIAYNGNWEKGQRHGYGVLNLGFGLGSYYKGEFRKDKKDGAGMIVTNNGLILKDQNLFIDDNFGTLSETNNSNAPSIDNKRNAIQEPFKFDICDQYIGLYYHIDQALKRLDKEKEIIDNTISEYLENNKERGGRQSCTVNNSTTVAEINIEEFMTFEEIALRKALQCYEMQLKSIYYQYATICNTEEVHFTPVLIRLYFWQLFYDCNIHSKGLTLIDIDRTFHANSAWLSKSPHNPFEKIYFWQFLHCLIAIASKLYAKRQLPEKKPDTILSCAFRTFMEEDILTGVGRKYGHLTDGCGLFVPLKGAYDLYRIIGEPCTIRDFLCAIRYASHSTEQQPVLVEEDPLLGQNAYVFGDEITYVADHIPNGDTCEKIDLKLFNIGNLSSKTIIKIFSSIFPNIISNENVINLDIELVFFEFFEVFIACVEESIRLKDEEAKYQDELFRKGSLARNTEINLHNMPKVK
ncbi:radial spoke head 10 homolog B-like isoform X2 [Leptidea sinapis]|uniref:radial spoke head 10 homolog B-like isoform X2 n=1 Tax=Leptidea sinapis TaxID=189913 RepID=UPI002130F4CF|nr:radial spoke head 10 homolog B-like isoform X2 [Leptidea sinapis]